MPSTDSRERFGAWIVGYYLSGGVDQERTKALAQTIVIDDSLGCITGNMILLGRYKTIHSYNFAKKIGIFIEIYRHKPKVILGVLTFPCGIDIRSFARWCIGRRPEVEDSIVAFKRGSRYR